MVREMLTRGDFNSMSQELQADGLLLIVMKKHQDRKVYKAWVRNLGEPSEEVIREEIT